MHEIKKGTLDFLEGFVNANFTNNGEVDKTEERPAALTSLKRLFFANGFELIPENVATKNRKGSKAVAHNTYDADYIKVSSPLPQCICPIVIKPISTKQGFLTYYFGPDSDRVCSHEELESFALCYEKKTVKKHDDYVQMSIACTSRQIGEDRRNNLAQRTLRLQKKASETHAQIESFALIPSDAWEVVKPSIALLKDGQDIIDAVEDMRASIS